MLGVAVATASAIAMKNVYLAFWAVRLGHVRIPWAGLGRLALNSVIAGLAACLVSAVTSGLWTLVLGAAAGAAAYLAASRLNRVLTADESALVNRLIGRKLWVY